MTRRYGGEALRGCMRILQRVCTRRLIKLPTTCLQAAVLQATRQKERAEQELRELTTDLEEDAKKRPAKRLEREERDELLRRCTRLRQTIGEVKRMEKNLALKKRFNAEQKQRVAEGRRPFFVPDITKKKHAAKYRWRDAGPGARGGVDSQGSGPPHHRGRQRADD